uniref:polyprenyl synthetase family protein n=1 Tax=Wolbachia endosymbiont of Pentidionis agamae TaxID=3110435 RepID=UPI002FD1BA1E
MSIGLYFSERYQDLSFLLTSAIKRFLPNIKECSDLYSAMQYSIFAPAKYIRSLLIFISSSTFGVKTERVLPVAVAVEFIHTYSLIHDDLPCMDNSNIRRGKPSCHKKFGEAQALLAGNSLLSLAFEILSSLKENRCCEIINTLSKAIGYRGMMGGQSLDIYNTYTSFDEIYKVHLMKTAKLFAASCEIGAIIGGASSKECYELYSYGLNLGLIFQAKDDILDSKQDKINNLFFILGEQKMREYIENLYNESCNNLKRILTDTTELHKLLDFIRTV